MVALNDNGSGLEPNRGLEPNNGPLEKLIDYSARNWLLTLMLVVVAAIWGYRSLTTAPLDAIPDLSDVQVIVFTDWPGRSPDLVEDQITYPLTTALLAAPEVRFVRECCGESTREEAEATRPTDPRRYPASAPTRNSYK